MFSKSVTAIFCIFLLTMSLRAQEACVEEGRSVGVYPGAPDCCEELELKPAPKGTYGTAGICVKKKECVEEGNPVGVYPGAPACCKGLKLKPAPAGLYGSAGTCVESRHPSAKKQKIL